MVLSFSGIHDTCMYAKIKFDDIQPSHAVIIAKWLHEFRQQPWLSHDNNDNRSAQCNTDFHFLKSLKLLHFQWLLLKRDKLGQAGT